MVAIGGGYVVDIELDLRSVGRFEWPPICEIGGYCCDWWLLMLSPPKERERAGGWGHDDHGRSSLLQVQRSQARSRLPMVAGREECKERSWRDWRLARVRSPRRVQVAGFRRVGAGVGRHPVRHAVVPILYARVLGGTLMAVSRRSSRRQGRRGGPGPEGGRVWG